MTEHQREAAFLRQRLFYDDVKVVTFRGMVQLSSFVNTKDQKNRAAASPRKPRVKEIRNNIAVKE